MFERILAERHVGPVRSEFSNRPHRKLHPIRHSQFRRPNHPDALEERPHVHADRSLRTGTGHPHDLVALPTANVNDHLAAYGVLEPRPEAMAHVTQWVTSRAEIVV